MLPLSFALGAGSQMLQPLAIAVIGGILISMVLSLLITPAMQFYLTRENQREELRSSRYSHSESLKRNRKLLNLERVEL
jgi:predicted RND superfamily exporter protein